MAAQPRTSLFHFGYRRSPDQDRRDPARHPLVVVGAGPVGLSAAIDLAQRGRDVVLLDDADRIGEGSRAICFSKRSLEYWDRLGVGQRMVEKGIVWQVGKVFLGEELVYRFDLLPEGGHKMPAFINLQQYYAERFLCERVAELPRIDLRWRNKVVGLTAANDHVRLTIDTPEGPYSLAAEYVIACDGARSSLRAIVGAEFIGETFEDQFLIADVRMNAEFPTERWFWFDPPFHPNQSVLLHHQPDDVWRIDFQLGWDADPVAERQPERVIPRVQALLGKDASFELEWVSIYTFACLRMASFRDRRVLFAGDAAHGVSPFGARGANSGVQDADNLAWKLRLVLEGSAPDRLLDTYASEREFAADENILNSTRSTDFITPKSEVSRTFRDAALQLARDCTFARRLVNSGRLSTPSTLADSPLNTVDEDAFTGLMVPGEPCTDAPVRVDGRDAWLLEGIGDTFTLILFGSGGELLPGTLGTLRALGAGRIPVRTVIVEPRGTKSRSLEGLGVVEEDGLVSQRFDARPGTAYLLRPDQHVCARWRAFDPAKVGAALARATCNDA